MQATTITENEARALPLLMPVPQFAQAAGMCKRTAYRAIERGEVPALRVGRRVMVRRSDLLALLGVADSPATTTAA